MPHFTSLPFNKRLPIKSGFKHSASALVGVACIVYVKVVLSFMKVD